MIKHKIAAITAAIALLISGMVYILYVNYNNFIPASSKAVNEPKSDLSFAVIGDIHGNTGKLKAALSDLHSINNSMDALVLNGDNVDQGLEGQYEGIKLVIDKNKKNIPDTIIANIGNHDYFDYSKSANTSQDVEHFKELYYKFSGESSVYHDKWIKGYHFISLGSESGNTKILGAVKADISEKQLDWFKTKLAEDYKSGKPIFVFLHQHIGTSIKGWIGVVQRQELIKILSQYPDAVVFTSHTHVLLSIDNVTENLPYTTVNTGGVSYCLKPDGYRVERLYDESQGIYVEVNGNKVTIKGRDFAKKGWIFTKEISK
mgnify:CR=1 FL=1